MPSDRTTPLPVSVVIAAYEAEEYIGDAIASALAQEPPPSEVIVVDDGSADATARRAAEAGADVIRLDTNAGQGPALNAGFAAAAQEWIAFLDADDEWRPGHLDRIWRARAGHVLVAETGKGTLDRRIYGHPGPGPLELTGPRRALLAENPVLPSGAMVRRDLAVSIGFTERQRAQDLEFLTRVLEHGTALVLPDVGVDYRQHAKQLTADGAATRHDHLAVVRSFADRPWFDRRVLPSAEATIGWDSFRSALRRRAWGDAAREIPRIAGSPTRVGATLRLLRTRRVARARIDEL